MVVLGNGVWESCVSNGEGGSDRHRGNCVYGRRVSGEDRKWMGEVGNESGVGVNGRNDES